MPTLLPCSVPWMGDQCSQTYAQAAGSAYVAFQDIWLTTSLLLFLVCTIQNIRLFRIRGMTWNHYHTSVPHQIFALAWVTTVILVIRGTDPNGWANHLPQWIDKILLNVTTSCVYNCFMIFVLDWIKVLHSISGRNITIHLQKYFFYSMLIMPLLLSILEVSTPIGWIWACALNWWCSLYNIVVLTLGWSYGVSMYLMLRECAPNMLSRSSSSPPTAQSSHDRTPTRYHEDRAKMRVIIHLLIFSTICSIIAITFQNLDNVQSIQIQYKTVNEAYEYPTFTAAKILSSYAAFPLAQALGIVVIMAFFRKVRRSSHLSRQNSARTFNREQNISPKLSPQSQSPTPTKYNYSLGNKEMSVAPASSTIQLSSIPPNLPCHGSTKSIREMSRFPSHSFIESTDVLLSSTAVSSSSPTVTGVGAGAIVIPILN